MTLTTLLKKPSAFAPLAMSGVALVIVAGFLVLFGVVQREDEGVAARAFQLLLVAQLPIVSYFGIRWLPQAPRQAALVLALQLTAWAVAVAPIVVLER